MQFTGLSHWIVLAAFFSIVGLITERRVRASRRAAGRERRRWFEYSVLAAQIARQQRGER
jgi:hypothetical protein